MIGEPPFGVGTVQDTMTCAFPAVATTLGTADGLVSCGSAEASADSRDASSGLVDDKSVPLVDTPAIRADAMTAENVAGGLDAISTRSDELVPENASVQAALALGQL